MFYILVVKVVFGPRDINTDSKLAQIIQTV